VILKVDKWRSKCAGEGMLIIGKRGRNDGGYFKPPTINTHAGHADVTVTFLAFKSGPLWNWPIGIYLRLRTVSISGPSVRR
jgi:hypothetical protein